jgi:hypothetical protein
MVVSPESLTLTIVVLARTRTSSLTVTALRSFASAGGRKRTVSPTRSIGRIGGDPLRDLQGVFGDVNPDADGHRPTDQDSIGLAGDHVDFSSYGGYVQRRDARGLERFLKRQPL